MLMAGPAMASPVGDWVAEADGTRVQITRCGQAYCGGPAGSAPTVAFNLRAMGKDRWRGPAVSVADGETHVVSMRLADETRLVVKGCLGLFCVEQVWRRVN
jgi:uncharacterized protein (DUF2147 family)